MRLPCPRWLNTVYIGSRQKPLALLYFQIYMWFYNSALIIPQIASCPTHCPTLSINYYYPEAPATGSIQGFTVFLFSAQRGPTGRPTAERLWAYKVSNGTGLRWDSFIVAQDFKRLPWPLLPIGWEQHLQFSVIPTAYFCTIFHENMWLLCPYNMLVFCICAGKNWSEALETLAKLHVNQFVAYVKTWYNVHYAGTAKRPCLGTANLKIWIFINKSYTL